MRKAMFSFAVAITASFVAGAIPAKASPQSAMRIENSWASPVEKVGYWRRYYRRYGHPVPYAYYPPAPAYYPAAPAYYPPAPAYYPPAPAYYPPAAAYYPPVPAYAPAY